MKLLYAPASSYCQRVLIAIAEKEAPVTLTEFDLFQPGADEDLARLNPFVQVPTLELDDGRVLFEASVIIEHVDLCTPPPRLVPADPRAALEVRWLERIIDIYVNAGRQALFDDSQRPPPERGSAQVLRAARQLETGLAFLDQRLRQRTWLAGEELTMADCAAAPTLSYLRMVFSTEQFPDLQRYIRRLLDRPSVARVRQEGTPQMTRMLANLRYPIACEPFVGDPHPFEGGA